MKDTGEGSRAVSLQTRPSPGEPSRKVQCEGCLLEGPAPGRRGPRSAPDCQRERAVGRKLRWALERPRWRLPA